MAQFNIDLVKYLRWMAVLAYGKGARGHSEREIEPMPSLRPFSLGYDKFKFIAQGGASSDALWLTLIRRVKVNRELPRA